ncbi:UPF0481 protein At3g47200-like [Aristolochia californica]|uniref:UPF0481 protein At3g47200-like n=1 Tax=Aristolochia californica TaxID=171875 RepID=UPI0035DAE9B9
MSNRRGDASNSAADPQDPLNEIQNFSGEELDDIKSQLKPQFARKPTTTLYVAPPNIYRVKREPYDCVFQYFGINVDYDVLYPKQGRKDQHIYSHMQSILSRNPNNTFESYLLAMNAMKEEITLCHLGTITMDLNHLIVLLLGCSQLLDCMLLVYEGKMTPDVDGLCSASLQELRRDMLLVGNQVPFFALQKMYDMLELDKLQYPSLVELCLGFFENFIEINRQKPLMESATVHHLLHLVHYHLIPEKSSSKPRKLMKDFFNNVKSLFPSNPPHQLPTSASRPAIRQKMVEPIPSARRLQDAGIKFRKNYSPGFSDITFYRGVLEIPYLFIDKRTESLLRNLVLWEQSYLTVGSYFTSYAIFMDYLINTKEDVEILNESGIIEQTLGSEEEVASIFNGLGLNIAYLGDDNDFLPHLCKEVNKYCRSKFYMWRSKLMADYFSNPWTVISFIAAFYLLVLTTIQTFFSAYAYYRPP